MRIIKTKQRICIRPCTHEECFVSQWFGWKDFRFHCLFVCYGCGTEFHARARTPKKALIKALNMKNDKEETGT